MAGHHPDPIFQTHDERLAAIMQEQGGTFDFDSYNPYPGHEAYPNPWYSSDIAGDRAVSVNISDIRNASSEFDVSQDLLQAVVYLENAHGWYDAPAEWVGANNSSRPGNVNGEIWADLLDIDPESVRSDSTINIRLTAAILSEISARLENPTSAAVATLYNNMAADYLTGYGLTIEQYMELRPWETGLYGLSGEILDGLNNPENYLNQLANHCFLADTSIQMWPLEPSIKLRADGSYDEQLVLSKVYEKPICEIRVGDLVVSYDEAGRLKPSPVTRTMTNTATHILDFWGAGVTPGHAYYCADGKFKDQHVPLMDILRTDGAVMRTDGTKVRAATNCKVGSMGDMMIQAAATMQKTDGTWTEPKPGRVRFGTRITLPDGRDTSLMELAHEEGWKVSDDGYMVGQMVGEDGTIKERVFHFPYTYGEELPKSEDYILARSDVTLEEIYAAGEWEQIGTRMAAPANEMGLNIHPTSTLLQPSKSEPNIPPAFADRPDAPRLGQARPLSRKQRRAMAANGRKTVNSKAIH